MGKSLRRVLRAFGRGHLPHFGHRKLSDGSQNISHESIAYSVRFVYNIDEPNHEGRNQIMSITATELKSNLGKYLLLAATEDIFILSLIHI